MTKNDRIIDYVEAAVLTQLRAAVNDLGQYGFISRSQLTGILASVLNRPTDTIGIESAADRLVEKGVVEVISDDLAGDFYSFNPDALVTLVDREAAVVNSILYKMRKVGLAFFNAAVEQATLASEDVPIEYKSMNAPASDRVVTLSHNQVESFDEPTSEIITAIERENTIADHPGLRELIIGQLRAGRELIRIGVFKAELLHMTLVVGLKMLVEKYGDHAIGALASKLLDLILKEIGIG